MSDLWCIRTVDPSASRAAPDKNQAEEMAAHWNRLFESDGRTLRVVVEPWPGTAEGHAESVADWLSIDDIKATAQEIIRLREERKCQ